MMNALQGVGKDDELLARDALSGHDATQLKAAIDEEVDSLNKMDCWEHVSPPKTSENISHEVGIA